MVLDHSGNILRFKQDYEDIYFNGLDALDTGEKLDKAIRKEPEDTERDGCPSCGYKPFFKRCMSCGFEVIKSAEIDHVPGHMREVLIGKSKAAENHYHLWQQCCSYVRAHGKPETQQGRAAHLFKSVVGAWPTRSWSIDATEGAPVSRAVFNKARANSIAWVKGRERMAT